MATCAVGFGTDANDSASFSSALWASRCACDNEAVVDARESRPLLVERLKEADGPPVRTELVPLTPLPDATPDCIGDMSSSVALLPTC